MPALHDTLLKGDVPGRSGFPRLVTLIDQERDLRYVGPEGLAEPANGWVYKWCVGDGSTTVFSLPTMPANVQVVDTAVIVSGTAITSTYTVSIGKSGTPAAYHAASAFGNTMATAGAKTTTTVKGYETTAVTPIATWSTAPALTGRCLIGVQYAKLPTLP